MVGRTVGKYRLVERIGRGGMGTVYRAVDETLQREVAIKVLNAEISEHETSRRFRAEALTLARLNHPGIATVYDLYQQDGELMMVMEFVRGETMQALSDRVGPMPVADACALCTPVLDALGYAHRLGVVHRDLKPSNLMVTETGAVKVMDFGIARIIGSEHLTHDGSMMGTPAYMAPEQVRGREIDGRADLYAMGVVLYRLLTARLPFEADTAIAIAQKQLSDPPTPLKLTRPDLPLWCEALLDRALAKAPAARFQTAEEFKAALASFTGAPHPVPMAALAAGDRTTYAMPTPVALQSSGFAAPPGLPDLQSVPIQGPAWTPQATRTPTQSTVIISGRSLLIGASVVAVLLIALLIAVLFAIRRPVIAELPAQSAQQQVSGPEEPAPPNQVRSGEAATGSAVGPEDQRQATSEDPAAQGATVVDATPTPPATRPAEQRRQPAGPQREAASARAAAPAAADVPSPQEAAESEEIAMAGDATTAAGAVARSATPRTFDGLKLLVLDGKQAREQEARLHFADGRIILIAVGERLVASFPFEEVTALSFSRSRQPRWRNADGSEGRADLPSGAFGFLRSDRRWFAIQTKDYTYVIRVEEEQVEPLARAAANRTGLPITRLSSR